MKLIYNSIFKAHDTGMHPENKKRLESLGNLPETDIEFDESAMSLVHKQRYIDQVKAACTSGGHLDPDTVVSSRSYEAAVIASNATLMASQAGDFAIVRPPGHHAYPSKASGFCLFNHVSIATQNLVNQGKKVLVFDFDGHLGDGTSEIFYESDKVVYWSMHQFPAFPGHGRASEIGAGKGAGFTWNNQLPPGAADDIFMDAFRAMLPYAKAFNPDVVAISAGFDAHQYDLLLDLRVTSDVYYEIGKELAANFNNLFATLEGGYNVEELPKCVFSFLDGINGDEFRFPEGRTESDIKVWDEYEINMGILTNQLNPYWKI